MRLLRHTTESTSFVKRLTVTDFVVNQVRRSLDDLPIQVDLTTLLGQKERYDRVLERYNWTGEVQ